MDGRRCNTQLSMPVNHGLGEGQAARMGCSEEIKGCDLSMNYISF